MASHGTIDSSRIRRRSVHQPPRRYDDPLDSTLPLSTIIPDDHTVEIMLRLPVKSLLRFCCVSKPWNSLISSSDFARNHLHRATTDPNLRLHRLLARDAGGKISHIRLSRSLISLIDNASLSPPFYDYLTLELRPSCFVIVGSCNGLICWLGCFNDHVHYMNPLTRVQSQSPCFTHPSDDYPCFNMFGFGYDHVSDSYKTVTIYCDPKADTTENKTIVKVYAMGGASARSWRKMQSLPFAPRWTANGTERCGKFVSGTLNWLAAHPDKSLVVVSVNIVNETCGVVMLPDVDNYEVITSPNLWVLGGCLCFSYNFNDLKFVLWQMKQYGVSESWTNLLNISYLYIGIDKHYYYCYPEPFFMLDNGEILFKVDKDDAFHLYNSRHYSFQFLRFQSETVYFIGTTHIESLVSPCPTAEKYNLKEAVHPPHTFNWNKECSDKLLIAEGTIRKGDIYLPSCNSFSM